MFKALGFIRSRPRRELPGNVARTPLQKIILPWSDRCFNVREVLQRHALFRVEQSLNFKENLDLLKLVRGILRVERKYIAKDEYDYRHGLISTRPVGSANGILPGTEFDAFNGTPNDHCLDYPVPETRAALNLFTPHTITRLCTQNITPILDILLFHYKNNLENIPPELDMASLQNLALIVILYHCFTAFSAMINVDINEDEEDFVVIDPRTANDSRYQNLSAIIKQLYEWLTDFNIPDSFTDTKLILLSKKPGAAIPLGLLDLMQENYERSPFINKVSYTNEGVKYEAELVADLLLGMPRDQDTMRINFSSETSWALRLNSPLQRTNYIRHLSLYLGRPATVEDLQLYANQFLPNLSSAFAHRDPNLSEMSSAVQKSLQEKKILAFADDDALAIQIGNNILTHLSNQVIATDLQAIKAQLAKIPEIRFLRNGGLFHRTAIIKINELYYFLELRNITTVQLKNKFEQLLNELQAAIEYYRMPAELEDPELPSGILLGQLVGAKENTQLLKDALQKFIEVDASARFKIGFTDPSHDTFKLGTKEVVGKMYGVFAPWLNDRPRMSRGISPVVPAPFVAAAPRAPDRVRYTAHPAIVRGMGDGAPMYQIANLGLNPIQQEKLEEFIAYLGSWITENTQDSRLEQIKFLHAEIIQCRNTRETLEFKFRNVIESCHKSRHKLWGGQSNTTSKLQAMYEIIYGLKIRLLLQRF